MFNINCNYKIYTTKIGLYIADCLKYMLDKMKYNTQIVYSISQEDIINNNNNPNEIYIILFCQTLQIIPSKNKYIIYQLEQVKQSKWIDNLYLKRIEESLFTLDYSLYNYKNFEKRYRKKIYYFPIPIIKKVNINKNIEIIYDLLFFGNLNNRRKNICRMIKNKYNILVINNLFGDDLYNIIMKSKIILNIHFYKNAILETARINDVLRFNKLIISEKSCDEKIMKFYNNIIYCDEIEDNFNNIDELYELIDNYLINDNYKRIIEDNILLIKKIYKYSLKKLIKISIN